MQTVDAKHALIIKVHPRNVKDAIPGDPQKCAIALAAEETVKGCIHAEVGRAVTYIWTKDPKTGRVSKTRYVTPSAARDQINILDLKNKDEFDTSQRYKFLPPSPSKIKLRKRGSFRKDKGKRRGKYKPRKQNNFRAVVRGTSFHV